MSMILYYSNYCDKCKTLLQNISKSSVKKDMHFICIDKRVKRENGATYIVLENGQEILLPPTVNKVPALLLLNRGHQVLFGNDINKYIEPVQVVSQQKATNNNGEPLAFSMSNSYGCGVASDNYSFLDQESSELSAKGNGGLRQIHHYATINYNDCIETPPDTYSADTIGNVSMEQLQQKRNTEINVGSNKR
jgi:hypothetical protein